jgi:hypothetical protein
VIADHGVVLTEDVNDKAAALRALHIGPGFVLPNAWDAGSARILEQVGFPAIATTSGGRAGEQHRRANALLARRQAGQPGGSMARAALSVVERAGRELLESGTLGFLDGAIPYADLQRRFTPPRPQPQLGPTAGE